MFVRVMTIALASLTRQAHWTRFVALHVPRSTDFAVGGVSSSMYMARIRLQHDWNSPAGPRSQTFASRLTNSSRSMRGFTRGGKGAHNGLWTIGGAHPKRYISKGDFDTGRSYDEIFFAIQPSHCTLLKTQMRGRIIQNVGARRRGFYWVHSRRRSRHQAKVIGAESRERAELRDHEPRLSFGSARAQSKTSHPHHP